MQVYKVIIEGINYFEIHFFSFGHWNRTFRVFSGYSFVEKKLVMEVSLFISSGPKLLRHTKG